MKTILFITAMLLSCSIYSQEEKENEEKNQENTRENPKIVYICNSMSSKRYHYKKDCTGLRNCKDSIVKISIITAKDRYARTICGYETHRESSSSRDN
ncbi:hypothetical protein IWQ47_001294 [Aquimarina sp. EL_43]|uniref:hypothetical protein n=1 Tax=unclassified Aquimarina TaxID=2627091 RepID=UPI0018C923DE|nr:MULTISPECIES: hypothetical protein [unclassified Aquimarina]MBG6129403.1 hypothetical protein [Aquimarina sp. EL_35]MBG6150468.1 hypothetical protein [Aquimarina sp. EL_32]MBG6168224.1 hypothetical protein [Aquimarina sp. EL_43]